MNCNTYSAVIGLSLITWLIWVIIYQMVGQIHNKCPVNVPSNGYITTFSNTTIYNERSKNLCINGVNCFQKCSFDRVLYERVKGCRPVSGSIKRNGSFLGLRPYYVTDAISLNHLCDTEQDYCLLTTKKSKLAPSTCGGLNIIQVNTTVSMEYHEYCFLNDSAIFYCRDKPYSPYIAYIGKLNLKSLFCTKFSPISRTSQ